MRVSPATSIIPYAWEALEDGGITGEAAAVDMTLALDREGAVVVAVEAILVAMMTLHRPIRPAKQHRRRQGRLHQQTTGRRAKAGGLGFGLGWLEVPQRATRPATEATIDKNSARDGELAHLAQAGDRTQVQARPGLALARDRHPPRDTRARDSGLRVEDK